jgi:hypothetical protein
VADGLVATIEHSKYCIVILFYTKKYTKYKMTHYAQSEYIDIIDISESHEEEPRRKCKDRKHSKSNVMCGIRNQTEFCVPLIFQQELIAGTGGVGFVPLSRSSQNLDRIYGTLQLKFNSKFSRLAYRLYVYNATNPLNRITGARLHSGAANVNGPIIVDLYNGSPRRVNGELSHGTLNNDNITINYSADAFNFNSIASIYEGIRQGIVYANVYSEQFTGGVIRGQLYLKDACN